MVLLENDSFLTELTLLYQKTRSSGAVQITMKKYDGRTKPKPKLRKGQKPNVKRLQQPCATDLCLIRACNGKKKLSTVVAAKDISKFHIAYTNVLKISIDGLKKHGKKKSSKSTVKVSEH